MKKSGDYEFYKNYLKVKWGCYTQVLFHLLRKYNLLDKIDDISLGRVRGLKEYVKNRQLVRFQVDFKYICQLVGSGCDSKTPKTIPVNKDVIDLVKSLNNGEVPLLGKIKNKIDVPLAISYSEEENRNKNLKSFVSNLNKKEMLTSYRRERVISFELEESMNKEVFGYEKNLSNLIAKNKTLNEKGLSKPVTVKEITGLNEEHLIERPKIKIPSYVEKVKIVTQRDVLAWKRKNIEEICDENVSKVLKTQKCLHERTSKLYTSTLKETNEMIWTEVKNCKNNIRRRTDENPYLKEIIKKDESFKNYFKTLDQIESNCINSDKMYSDVHLNFNETEDLRKCEKEIQEFRIRTTVGKNCLQNSINVLKKYDPDVDANGEFKKKCLTRAISNYFEVVKSNPDNRNKRNKPKNKKRIESNKKRNKINKEIRNNIKIITDDESNTLKAIQFLNQEANNLIRKKDMIINSCTKFSKLFRADCNVRRNKSEIEMISCLPKMREILSEIGKSKSYNAKVLEVLESSTEEFNRFVNADLRRREASTSSRRYNFR